MVSTDTPENKFIYKFIIVPPHQTDCISLAYNCCINNRSGITRIVCTVCTMYTVVECRTIGEFRQEKTLHQAWHYAAQHSSTVGWSVEIFFDRTEQVN